MDNALIVPAVIMGLGAVCALFLVSWRVPRVGCGKGRAYANEWARRRGVRQW